MTHGDKIQKLMLIFSIASFLSFFSFLIVDIFYITSPSLLKWDEIPGKDSDQLIKYLEQNYNVFLDKEKINKTDHGRTIIIPDYLGDPTTFIRLSDDKKKVILEIYANKTYFSMYPLDVKIVNDRLEIWDSLNWHEIPGNDSDKLLKYIESKYDIYFINEEQIEKISNDTIIISDIFAEELDSLHIYLDYDKWKAVLSTYKYLDNLNVKMINGHLYLEIIPNSFLLSWDEIQKNDSYRLEEYLKQNYHMNWINEGDIKKTNNSISISDVNNSIYIDLNSDKTKAFLSVYKYLDSFDIEKKGNDRLYLDIPLLLSWDEITGINSDLLIKYLEYNRVNWNGEVKIEKINDGRTIIISDNEMKYYIINLNNNKMEISWNIYKNKTYKWYFVENENGILNIKIPPTNNISNEEEQKFPIIAIFSILITLVVSYRNKISNMGLILISIILFRNTKNKFDVLIKLEELYPTVPFFIMGLGYSMMLGLIYIEDELGIYLAILSFVFIFFSFILLIVTLFAKRSLEGRIHFTLEKAYRILDKIEDKNNIDIKNLKRYIYLTYKNVKKRMGNGLDFKEHNESDAFSDLEYILSNYLSYYIEFGGKEQLYSLKSNLETMLNSVNDNDEINWNSFTPAIIKLNDDIIEYLRDINFNLIYRTLPKQLEWINKNKDTLFQAIGLIIPIILFILGEWVKRNL